MAEYEACILRIRMAVDMNIKEILLCKKFSKIEFRHIPMIQNEFTDVLPTLSSMIQHPDKNYIDPIEIEIRYQHAYIFHVDEKPDGKPWYYDVKNFRKTREYLENEINGQKRVLRRLENHFFLNGEVLYRRIPHFGLLRCVDTAEATGVQE
nr:uncharacterized protein LOC104114556 [Nicotiana tomentosiformis]